MNSPGLRFLGAALIVLAAMWGGARLYLAAKPQNHRAVTVPAGEASPPDPRDLNADQAPGGAQATIPARLPSFSLKDLSGKPTPISAWSGKSLVINFWATWCAPCRREMPLLESLAAEWADKDIAVVGVAVDDRDKVAEFAHRFNIDFPLLVGEQDALEVAAKFGMDSPAFPFTVFADRNGEVVALYVGELRRPQADLILSVVQNLNQNRVVLPEAKRLIARGLAKLAEKAAG